MPSQNEIDHALGHRKAVVYIDINAHSVHKHV